MAKGRGGRKLAGIDFSDLAVGLPAALIIMLMPFSYSITNGIGFGFIAYSLILVSRGQAKKIHPFVWLATLAFVLNSLVPLLQDHLSWV